MTEITKLNTHLPALPVDDLDEEIKENFQAHLILLHDISEPVKEGKGKAGNYFISDMDLGPEIVPIWLFRRWHAKLTVNGVKQEESFDKDSETFKTIKNTQTNMKKGIMARWGISLLGYLPSHGIFFIYHPSSPSARPTGKNIAKFITPKKDRTKESDMMLPETNIVALKSYHVEKGVANPFWKPVCDPLPMVYFEKKGIEIPPKDKIKEQIDLFLAPTLIKEEVQEEGSDR